MRRKLSVLVVLLVVVAAVSCSGDDGDDAGSGGDFCEQASALEAIDETDSGVPTEEDLERFRAWVDSAPEEIRDDVQVLADLVEQLTELDQDDPDAFGAIFGLFLDPEVIAATESLERYLEDECGIEVESDGEITSDPFAGEDEPSADDGGDEALSLDALDAYLADEGFAWADDVTSSGLGTYPGGADVTMDLAGGASIDDASEACDAAVAYFSQHVAEVVVAVTIDGEDAVATDDGGDCAES